MKLTSILFLSLPLIACGGSSSLQASHGETGGGPGQPDTASPTGGVFSTNPGTGGSPGTGGNPQPGTGGGLGRPDGASSTGGVFSTNPGTGGTPGTGGSPGAGCTGDLQAVSAALGMNCPLTYCEAESMVSSCTSLPPGVTRMSVSNSGFGAGTMKIDFSATRGKGCAYSSTQLAGAVAWDDVAGFCNGTSTTIEGGTVPPFAQAWSKEFQRVCDRASLKGPAGAVEGTIPPALCYTNWGCYPCCPATPPDCSGKPDGYPGYLCAGGDYYCVWQCRSGKWQWAC